MKMIVPLTNRQRDATSKTKQIPPSAIDRMTHDIVNQLSIITLCCCELHNSLAEKLEPDQLKEFGRIEIAVQQAADMIQQLKLSWQDHEHTANATKSDVNRIEAEDGYPLLSSFLMRR